MQYMSFAMTQTQLGMRAKKVTRRLGWPELKVGTLLQPVAQCQGLKKGQKVCKLGPPILVTSVRRERLDRLLHEPEYAAVELPAEGFPEATAQDFVKFFCVCHRGCKPETLITRIEFEYQDGLLP